MRGHRTTIECYIYRHGQGVGYQVRRVKKRGHRVVKDVSRYFGIMRHGTLSKAAQAAREWKQQTILRRW